MKWLAVLLLSNLESAEPSTVDHKYIAECWSDNVEDYIQVRSFFTLLEVEQFIKDRKDCRIIER